MLLNCDFPVIFLEISITRHCNGCFSGSSHIMFCKSFYIPLSVKGKIQKNIHIHHEKEILRKSSVLGKDKINHSFIQFQDVFSGFMENPLALYIDETLTTASRRGGRSQLLCDSISNLQKKKNGFWKSANNE